MRPVFTAAEMRAVDARAIDVLGIPGPQLMERAGTGAADGIARAFAPIRDKRIAIVCGKGNNGGDGFVVARRLRARGARVQTFLLARRSEVTGDAAVALARWRGRVDEIAGDERLDRLRDELARADVVVDALLGTGLSGPARGLAARAIEVVNAAGRPVVALDLPSGLGADTGAILGPAVRAAWTATFVGHKRCLLLHPAASLAGHVDCVDIGIPRDEASRDIATFLLEEPDVRAHFPPRAADAHKGTYGHLLIVAGSRGKTGAAGLAGRAALRSGVGLCTIATPVSQQPVVAALGLEFMTEAMPETSGHALSLQARQPIVEHAARTDALAVGPGISVDAETQELIRMLVAEVDRPMVVDADALTALTGHLDLLDRAAGPRVLTPHPGEMARMLGTTAVQVQADRIETARGFARRHRVHLALKGAGTVIAAPDGQVFINPTGNPGMASGGAGDVLTGMTGAFLARGLDPLAAIQAACFFHGLAGDRAVIERGEDGLIAGDIVEAIGPAMRGARPASSPP